MTHHPRRIPAVSEQPTMPIPDAGRILVPGMSTVTAYRAARKGILPTVAASEYRRVVPTARLREMLGLPIDGPGIDLDRADAADTAHASAGE